MTKVDNPLATAALEEDRAFAEPTRLSVTIRGGPHFSVNRCPRCAECNNVYALVTNFVPDDAKIGCVGCGQSIRISRTTTVELIE